MPGLVYTENRDARQDYRIQLSNFEGPLDLLLFLIRKDELDIYDIPIAEITRQYLDFIDIMKELDLEVAGEFILMAATLIQIKAKMLLPRPEIEGGEEMEEDPRAELVRQLLEYKRYKEVAEQLGEIEDRRRRLFSRSDFSWQKPYHSVERELVLKDLTLFDLFTAFKAALDNMPKEPVHDAGSLGVTVEEQIAFILSLCDEKERFTFGELIPLFPGRIALIVTFIAILELIRTRRIVAKQASTYGEIWIMRR
ncbi:MAG TPA: hypothetical protein ENN17_02050 [bacterium]|nr:hypothetical protein [bacterium]